jgi:Protein of unknown function (DUF3309)
MGGAFSLYMRLPVILILFIVLPTWPHSRAWELSPGGALGNLVLVLLTLVLLGKFFL